MKNTSSYLKKYPIKKYPTIGVCGLDCGLCPRYYTVGPSRCPGCAGPGFFEKHPSCFFITCAVKKKSLARQEPGSQLEVCAECSDFPCFKFKSEEEYQQLAESPSYPSYRKVIPNFTFIKKHGIEKFIEQQQERIRLLKIMRENFDDGRSRSFFCRAANLLEITNVKSALDEAARKINSEKIKQNDIKTKAKILREILLAVASKEGIELTKKS
jgi:hypothetical protein